MALNRVVLMGRFTRDPEMRTTPSGLSVLSFCIAVDRPKRKDQEHPEADFINCVAWRERAEMISKYFSKGQRIALEGALQSRKYTDKDGNNRSAIEVLVDSVTFVERREDSGRAAPPPGDTDAPPAPPDASAGNSAYTDDDDLPF